jgi:hypothetical protein
MGGRKASVMDFFAQSRRTYCSKIAQQFFWINSSTFFLTDSQNNNVKVKPLLFMNLLYFKGYLLVESYYLDILQ